MEKEFREKLFEFFKDAYFFQFERREKINGRIGVLLVIVTVAANIAVRYLNDFPKFDGSVMVAAFYLGLISALVLGAVTLYHLWGAIARRLKWHYLPTPQQILAFIQQTEKRKAQSAALDSGASQNAFETNLIRQFAEAATYNDASNDIKNRHISRATQWAIATVVALVACAPPFYYLRFKEQQPAQRVEIIRPIPTSP